MSPVEIWKSPHTKSHYKIKVLNQPILVCDILGFKNLVLNSHLSDLKQIMLNLVDAIIGMSLKDIGLHYFSASESITEKIKDFFPEKYNLDAAIISDTIIIYPSIDIEGEGLPEEISTLLLSIVSIAFFEYMIKIQKILIRGTITHGEYCVIDDPRVVFGKAVIEAYELEMMQNWGGILISPILCSKLRKSPIIYTIFKEYLEIPIKDQYKDEFEKRCLEASCLPHVLNWPNVVKDVNWEPIYDKVELITDTYKRKNAQKLIDNSKIFYENSK